MGGRRKRQEPVRTGLRAKPAGARKLRKGVGCDRGQGTNVNNKTGVSDVPKTFWKAGVARGKSTTTAKHVRDPTGQPRECHSIMFFAVSVSSS